MFCNDKVAFCPVTLCTKTSLPRISNSLTVIPTEERVEESVNLNRKTSVAGLGKTVKPSSSTS